MMPYTDMTGLAGSALAMAAAAVLLCGWARLRGITPAILAGVTLIVAFVPVGGLPLAAYVRGMTGDLSITSLVLLMLFMVSRLTPGRKAATKEKYPLLVLAVLAAAVLYPMALGAGDFDPYRMGYGNVWFIGGLFAVTLAAFLRRLDRVALIIALAVLAWATGWYESANLWDYLLDPFLILYALGALAMRGAQDLRRG
jgi:hypothetical protein